MLSPGSAVPRLALPDAEGSLVTLDPRQSKASVVVFTCNHCPYALAWHDRIQAVARDYSGLGVTTLQVNSNDSSIKTDDSLAKMHERVRAGHFAGPYLHDAGQSAAAAWGARVTPECFVVDAAGVLRYHGAPDGDYQDEDQQARWLRDALDSVLAERVVEQEQTSPRGCSVKWRVEVHYWSGCPSFKEAVALAEQALEGIGRAGSPVVLREVATSEQARQEGFVGSPTFRVGGQDLFADDASEPSLTCRVYRRQDGRPSPLPDQADLEAALLAAVT